MSGRETFGSRVGMLASMIGLAVGLGNVWRFPYMVGQFGGGAFLLLYLVIAALVAVPALMGEWSLGRHTRRGPLGAYERAGAPMGRAIGWLLIVIVWVAVGYYTNAIGWVVFHWITQLVTPLGLEWEGAAILPPETGFSGVSLGLQLLFTGGVLLLVASVLLRGVRSGIERASKVLTPLLFVTLLVVVARALTLPDALEGVRWLFSFELASLTPVVAAAALGQVVFSVGLGGAHMVVYGSYLADDSDIRADAAVTVLGDTSAGLLAGLAIFPAVFAYGLEPASGPGLLFATLPRVFEAMPAGWLFGTLFFGGLSGAALLSGIAAYEVIVAGFTDTLGWTRKRAVWTVYVGCLVLAVPPMINLQIFVPWDLIFGSGGQTLGALIAVVTVGWVVSRAALLEQVAGSEPSSMDRALILWLRWVVPAAVLAAAAWWFASEVLGASAG